MAVFKGDLWLAAEPASRFPATVELSGDRVLVLSGASTIGAWNRDQMIVSPKPEGFHILVEGEVLVFQPESPEFAKAFGIESDLASRIHGAAAASSVESRPMPIAPETIAVPSAPTSSNGMAVTSMVLGIVGVLLGLVPLFGLFALGAGVLALIFGVLGRGKVKRGDTPRGNGMGLSGVILGAAAIGLGILGLTIVNNAFNDFSSELDEISETLNTFGELGESVTLRLDECTSDGASGSVVNNHTASLDIAIDVFFYDSQGTQVDTSFAFINGVRPGGRAVWEAVIFGTEYERCAAEVSSAFES